MNAIRITLADAQPVFREGIKSMLLAHQDVTVVSEAGNTPELLDQLSLYCPDILILDYNPLYFDNEAIQKILNTQRDCRVIILSSQEKRSTIFKALELNVCSYLTKECSRQDLYKAIRSAARGEKFFCSFIVDILLEDKVSPSRDRLASHYLTERETLVTRLVALGKVNKEIAYELNLSPHTIHTHRKNIMKKLGLHSAVDLTNYAKETGIVH